MVGCHLRPSDIKVHAYFTPNARLTPVSRAGFVLRNIQDAEDLAHLAAQAGIGLRTAYKWLTHCSSGGVAALVDRRCFRRSKLLTLDQQYLQRAVLYAMNAPPSGASLACWPFRSPPSAELSKPLVWTDLNPCSHRCRCGDTSGPGSATLSTWTPNSWPGFNASATGSLAIGDLAARLLGAPRKLMWPSTMSPVWLTPMCHRMRTRPTQSAS
jgi:hypothetical protein